MSSDRPLRVGSLPADLHRVAELAPEQLVAVLDGLAGLQVAVLSRLRPASATETGTSIIEPSCSARPSRRAPGPESTTSPTQRASGCAM